MRALTNVVALALALAGMGCATPVRTCPPAFATAAIAEDGTITLQSVRPNAGPVTQPRRAYAKDHPQYAQLLEHVGAIEPETEKLIEDWPAVACE
jgi:hypothetical protein